MHISYEAGELEDPKFRPSKDMFEMTVDPKDAPDKETKLVIEFKQGVPVSIENLEDKTKKTGALEILTYLNKIAGANGVGRADLVENRFVGMKSRGVYETPAGTVLRVAHMDLEGITMDREVMRLRDMLVPKIAELMYNGFWYSPEMELLMAMVSKSQENVSGKVTLSLYKGNVMPIGRESAQSLYNPKIASMDVHGGYDQTDATGFIKLNALRLKQWASRKK
jgi:argininosuccinate synthase